LTVTVLFTEEDSQLTEGCEHLVGGGIWVKQFKESGLSKAYVYCLDKTLMNDFVNPFGLKNIKVDVQLNVGDYFLSVVMIKFWGKKLDAVLDWKKQMESSVGTSAVSQGEAGLRRQSSGESAEELFHPRHQDTDGDLRADHREGQKESGEEIRIPEED
jgi:hypothetical protein